MSWSLVGISQDSPITVFSAAARRLWIAEQADHCVKWLKAQGLEVLHVEKGQRTPPRIIIRHSPLCDRFEGAVECYSRALNPARTVQAELRYKMVMRFDCEVRWDEKCAPARREVRLKLAYKKAKLVFHRLLSWMGGTA